MLVLSRKIGERIFIGEGVEVSVVRVKGNRVMLGVVAPEEVPIHREEIAPNSRFDETDRSSPRDESCRRTGFLASP